MSMLTRWNPFRQSIRFDPLTDVDDLFRNLNLRPCFASSIRCRPRYGWMCARTIRRIASLSICRA
jgi:hypothetical protein